MTYVPPQPCLVDSRAWCRAYADGRDGTLPLPGVNGELASASMPAPITYTVTALSTNPGSNLQIEVQVAGVEGGWATFPGLVALPILGFIVSGRTVRVVRSGGALAPGELVAVTIAPLTWPSWAMPDPRAWVPAPGLYR